MCLVGRSDLTIESADLHVPLLSVQFVPVQASTTFCCVNVPQTVGGAFPTRTSCVYVKEPALFETVACAW